MNLPKTQLCSEQINNKSQGVKKHKLLFFDKEPQLFEQYVVVFMSHFQCR